MEENRDNDIVETGKGFKSRHGTIPKTSPKPEFHAHMPFLNFISWIY